MQIHCTWKMSRTDKNNEEEMQLHIFSYLQTWFGRIVDYGFKFSIKCTKYKFTIINLFWSWTQFVCLFVCLFVYFFLVPLANFSLIWRCHLYRWRASNFGLCSVIMAIDKWEFFSLPHNLRWRYTPSICISLWRYFSVLEKLP